MDAARVAQDLMTQAAHDEDAAFNLQHALAREGERAANQIIAEGEDRARRIAAEQARQARVDAEASRFDPEGVEEPAPAVPAAETARPEPGRSAPIPTAPTPTAPSPTAPAGRPAAADADDDDDLPARWLT